MFDREWNLDVVLFVVFVILPWIFGKLKKVKGSEDLQKRKPLQAEQEWEEPPKKAPLRRELPKEAEALSSLIPKDHQSSEGISANPDYREAQRERAKRGQRPERIEGDLSKQSYLKSRSDLRKAMILKEILDRPLSLRERK